MILNCGGHAKATESLLLKQNEFLMALIKNETSAYDFRHLKKYGQGFGILTCGNSLSTGLVSNTAVVVLSHAQYQRWS